MRKQNPWLTPTESFESDETKEEPLRAPPGLDGPMRDGLMAFFQAPSWMSRPFNKESGAPRIRASGEPAAADAPAN